MPFIKGREQMAPGTGAYRVALNWLSLSGLVLLCLTLNAQDDDQQVCSFRKVNDVAYYLLVTEHYATKGNLDCFCALTDSLTQWSYKTKGSPEIAVIDSIFSSTDGVFSEYGEKVAGELFKHNFANFSKRIITHTNSTLWLFLREAFVNEVLDARDKDGAIKKQRKMFADKVKSSKLSSKEKAKMLALLNALVYSE